MRLLTTTALALPALWLASMAPAQIASEQTSEEPAAEQQAIGEPIPPVSEQLDDPKTASVTIVGHVVEPMQLEPTEERIERLSLPEGFDITVFARDLVNPRMVDVADDGTVYVTRRSVGDVMMLRDENGDEEAEAQQSVPAAP